jgi:hypothetical protein
MNWKPPQRRHRQPLWRRIADWLLGLLIVGGLLAMVIGAIVKNACGGEPTTRLPWSSTFAALCQPGMYALPDQPAAACECQLVEVKKEPAPTPATPSLEDRETTWTKYLAAKNGWRDDVVAWDGSLPDLVTPCHAIEVDWATHKWKEAIGQAFDYAATMQRRPAVLLLVKAATTS